MNLIRIMPAQGSGGKVIQIQLNGKTQDIPPDLNVGDLLRQLKINPRQIAVSINWEVVIPSQFEDKKLKAGDEVEVFHAVGGG